MFNCQLETSKQSNILHWKIQFLANEDAVISLIFENKDNPGNPLTQSLYPFISKVDGAFDGTHLDDSKDTSQSQPICGFQVRFTIN